MDSTTVTPPLLTDILPPVETKEEIHSFYEALPGLPDLRRGQGKRSSLAFLLGLLLLAKLAGQTTLSVCTCFGYGRCESLVEQIEAFEFVGKTGGLRAHQERHTRGRAYWYAFPLQGTHRQKVYLGRSSDLKLMHLETVAQRVSHNQPNHQSRMPTPTG